MPSTNFMDFPAAVLQMPNFDVNQPDYINYGNMGSIMGHELTHAFDNNGKNYGSNGEDFNWVSICYNNYIFILMLLT